MEITTPRESDQSKRLLRPDRVINQTCRAKEKFRRAAFDAIQSVTKRRRAGRLRKRLAEKANHLLDPTILRVRYLCMFQK